MNVIVTPSYQASCLAAANMIKDVVSAKPNAKLGLATGGTPVPIYQALIEMNRAGEIDFSAVRTVNLDEYCGLAPSHPQSYRFFMDANLFNHVNINKANTFVASGLGSPEESAAELERMVYEGGAPDLQLLGIGGNGHVGFNEAGEQLRALSHTEQLTESTIDANARFFESRAEVPTMAVTMGMGAILAAKQVVLVATGPSKQQAIAGLLGNDEITTRNPATFLKLHGGATIIIDEELAALAGYKG